MPGIIAAATVCTGCSQTFEFLFLFGEHVRQHDDQQFQSLFLFEAGEIAKVVANVFEPQTRVIHEAAW